MHDNLGGKAEEDKLEETDSKSEACPVMSVFQHLETVTIHVNLAIKVHVIESLHGDLVSSTVLELIGRVLEGKVVLNWAAGKLDLLVLAGDERRRQRPESDQDRDGGEEAKEDGSLQTTADLPSQVEGDDEEDGEEELVGKAISAGAISWKGGILDGRVLWVVLAV